MNKIGFGFLRLPPKVGEPSGTYDWDAINNMVDIFMDRGGRYFDTCYTYLNGMSEYAIRECVVKRHRRESFELADKLPGYRCRSHEDCRRFFDEELERCGVERFDVYMLHWLNGDNYRIAEKYGEFDFLRELKGKGLAGKIGFSYHDNAALLDRILTKYPDMDVVQLQINYLDWDTAGIESGKCYEVCLKHGKRVTVMEPIKGGTLSALPEAAVDTLKALHPDWSYSSWALRFVQSLDGVEMCLSGMNAAQQVVENMEDIQPLTPVELSALERVKKIIESSTAVPCTGCRYCVEHCPKKILIPDYFKMFNEVSRYPDEAWKIKPSYLQTALTHGRASDCIACGSCSRHCPQHLDIPALMKLVKAAFG